eukprot:TRINITY_DN4531_c0_g1_i4.p2 TRINITY_DN4531_c0_g1~~TRINITY_DN4531_c0_g1_i4.p2  ORF type:complete len:166 (-),score=15.00 TRINITY_DN4531_c0_g1_i4:90-587(-)
MVIESRYKNLAMYRKYSLVCFYLQFLAVTVKVAWSMIPFLQGQSPPNWVYILPSMELVTLLLFVQGRIGGNKENTSLVMSYSVLLGIMAVQHVIVTYMYYLQPPFAHFAYILASHLGGTSAADIGHQLKFVEYCLDSLTFTALLAACTFGLLYVSGKQAAASKRA